MRKFEELINLIITKHPEWKRLSVRGLRNISGYSYDASQQTLKALKTNIIQISKYSNNQIYYISENFRDMKYLIKCSHCRNEQTYAPRKKKKIPFIFRTNCKKCGKGFSFEIPNLIISEKNPKFLKKKVLTDIQKVRLESLYIERRSNLVNLYDIIS